MIWWWHHYVILLNWFHKLSTACTFSVKISIGCSTILIKYTCHLRCIHLSPFTCCIQIIIIIQKVSDNFIFYEREESKSDLMDYSPHYCECNWHNIEFIRIRWNNRFIKQSTKGVQKCKTKDFHNVNIFKLILVLMIFKIKWISSKIVENFSSDFYTYS